MQSVLKKWRSIFTLSVNLYTKPALYQVLIQRRVFSPVLHMSACEAAYRGARFL